MMAYTMYLYNQSVTMRGIDTIYVEYQSGLRCRTHFEV